MSFTFRTDTGAPDARKPVRHFVHTMALSAIMGIIFAAPAEAAEDPYDGNWHFTLTPYAWLPSLDGTLHFDLPNGSPNVDASAGDILDRLDFAFMAAGDVRAGNWSLFTDFLYMDLSNDKATVKSVTGPGGLVEIPIDIGSQSSQKGFLWTLAASYTLLRGPTASLEVFAGFRDAQLKATLDWQFAGPLGAFAQSGSTSDTTVAWAGLIGLKGRIRLGERGMWFIPYYADIGWGASVTTWQGLAGVGYAFPWGDLLLSYRYLHYDADQNRLLDDLSIMGPALGATFHF